MKTTNWAPFLLFLLGIGCDSGSGKGSDTSRDTDGGRDDSGATVDCSELLYRDADGDGYGLDTETRADCVQEDGWVWLGGDCNDTDATISPGAPEVCDEADNDCDTLIDDADPGVDASAGGGFPRYTDADGDDYGAGEPTFACLPPAEGSGTVDNDADCDDTDPAIHPGAVEVCNALDDDCDTTTPETGIATFTRSTGEARNITPDLRGSAKSPAWLSLVEDGTLALCAGTWYARLDLKADLTVWGPAGAASTTLDGGGAGSVISVAVDGASIHLEGLTLTGGEGSGHIPTTGTDNGGGGLYCAGSGTVLSATDLVARGNHAFVSGGIHLDGCDAVLSDLVVENNAADYYGGGLSVLGGTVSLEDARIEDNISGSNGGGLFVVSDSGPASLSLTDSLVYSNTAARAGGAEVVDAVLSCTGSSSLWAGVVGNTTLASGEGAVSLTDYNRTASFAATSCDLGTDSGGDNNIPADFSHTDTDYGDDVTMTCTSDGCTP